MSDYRSRRVFILRSTAKVLRSLPSLWPVLLVAAFYLSPVTPHLRWTYTYKQVGQGRMYYACQYMGVEGLIPYMQGSHCPVVALIDRNY